MFDLTVDKETALHRAAMNGHLPMVEHLVKSAGFDVKDKNKVCMQTKSFDDLSGLFLAWVFVFCEMPYGAIYVLQSYFVHSWQQSGFTLEVFICLSACNYKRPHLRMNVIIIV